MTQEIVSRVLDEDWATSIKSENQKARAEAGIQSMKKARGKKKD